jgi:hypothetical protein
MTTQTQDPADQWADLLQELTGRRRNAAVSALRQSAMTGWPASRESVASLVAYAQGRISSREYAAQTLVSLGLADAHTAPQLLRAAAEPEPTHHYAPPRESAPVRSMRSSAIDANAGAEFLSGSSMEDHWRRD